MQDLHISLAAEQLGKFLGFPVTNTLITTLVVSLLLVGLMVFIRGRLRLVPGRFQTLVEYAVGGIYDYVVETLESEGLARKYFPLIVTIFLVVLLGNLLHFVPGVGSIGIIGSEGLIPLFRPIATDLNFTLALAIIAVIAVEIAGITVLGTLKYGGKFVNLRSPLGFAVGILDLFSELARFISFSFGNQQVFRAWHFNR